MIVTLNPKVLYRGLFKGPLGHVAKERERERERSTASETRLVSRARTEREREREDRESAPFVEARYDVIKHTFWVMRERMSRDFPPI